MISNDVSIEQIIQNNISKIRKYDYCSKGTNNLDFPKIKTTLGYLRNIADKSIKNLTPTDNNNFRYIIDVVTHLYNSEHCSQLIDLVKEHFNDLNNAKPGTIGAYFSGCLIDNISLTKLSVSPVCAPTCLNTCNIGPEKWSFCDHTVIWAYLCNKSDPATDLNFTNINFTLLNKIENSDRALVFLHLNSPNSYPGFSESEKSYLKSLNIMFVRLIGFYSTGNRYIDLTSWIPIEEIKSRIVITSTQNSLKQEFETNADPLAPNANIALVLLIIFVLLILLFFIWRISSQS